MTPPWGLYVHVPWCRIRCPYCAFHVEPERGPLPADAFVDRVARLVDDRRAWGFEGPPHTVYLGGGTPSRLQIGPLARLLDALVDDATVEVTVEANPEDVDDAWVAGAVDAGVTRVSLGVQTLDPDAGRRLGRARTVQHAREAAARVADAFPTWSADLMFGLHRQDPDAARADLAAVLALEPPHVSLYGLTIEEGTPYERAAARGAVVPADDDAWRAMYGGIVDDLEAAGLHRYEVSNAARPGHEAVHNRGYWEDRPYLGVGPSAHGYAPDGTRWTDVADTAAWLVADDPVAQRERPTGLEAAADRIIAGLRGVQGVDVDQLAARTGHRPEPTAIDRLVRGGVLQVVGGRMALAPEGFYVADAVTAALVEALAPVAGVAGSR